MRLTGMLLDLLSSSTFNMSVVMRLEVLKTKSTDIDVLLLVHLEKERGNESTSQCLGLGLGLWVGTIAMRMSCFQSV